jgi:hypothetical protein
VCAHIGSPLPWMSRLRRPSGLPPAQTSGHLGLSPMACPPDRSHRAPAAITPRRSRAPRPPRPGRDPHPSSLFGLVPPASPSETAPRVYTRDGLPAGGEASMPCQQAKRFGGEGRCREPPDVCTREMGFLASAELYWGFLPKTASRVYTRDSLSGKDWPQLPINRGNAPAEHGPCQKSRPACTRGAHFLPVGGVGRVVRIDVV